MNSKKTKPKKKIIKPLKNILKSLKTRKVLAVFLACILLGLALLLYANVDGKIKSLNGETMRLNQTVDEIKSENSNLKLEIQKKDDEIKTLTNKLTFKPEELLELTNAKRLQAGRQPLSINSKLNESARLKAEDMIKNSYWAHDSPDGTEPWVFFDRARYSYSWAGENLAKGYNTGNEMVAGWMISPAHKENLLSKKYREVGFSTIFIDSWSPQFNKQLTVAHYGAR